MKLALLVTLISVKLALGEDVCEYNYDRTQATCSNLDVTSFPANTSAKTNVSVCDKLILSNVTGSLNFLNYPIFEHLTYLSISGSKIDSFSLDKNFPNLQFLVLAHNKLPKLTPNFFGQVNERLNWLSLVANDHKIDQDSIHPLKNLTWLHIQSQKLEHLTGELLKEAIHMHELTVRNCMLKEIDDDAFDNTPEMEILSLNFNEIKQFKRGTFENLKKLKILELHHNKFVDLNLDQFRGLTGLEVLGLPSNFLKNIRNITELMEVFPNLRKMEIKKKDLTKKQIRPLIDSLRMKKIQIIGTPHDCRLCR